MWWIVWSGWPRWHGGLSLKINLWRWCDVLAWRVWILLSTDHCFRGRSTPGGSSIGSLTSSLLAMILSVQRLCYLSLVLHPASLKTFAEPLKGFRNKSRMFGRFCRSSWIGSSGLALMQSNSLSIIASRCTSGGWDVRQDWEPLHGCWFHVSLIIHISVFSAVSKCFVWLLSVQTGEHDSTAE